MRMEDLNTLKLWANKWQMMFNPDKCKLIGIINTKLPILHDYNNILEKKIKVASSVKYLGVYIWLSRVYSRALEL